MVETADTNADRPWWRRLATRLQLRRVVTRNLLVITALAGLAVTQPLLDLFGRNPEFFVAQDATSAQIVVFALVVTFLVPLVCLVLELGAFALGDRVGRTVHLVLVALLATAFGLTVANQVGVGDLPSVLMASAIGIGLTVAVRRIGSVEQILRYLAAAPVLFLVAFLAFSRSGELIRATDAEAARGVEVGTPAPVVVVQFDALPVASLLDPTGALDDERYPGFARLAAGASWFRNATSMSPDTTQSIPAALSGQMPVPGSLPTSSDHPRNLFTLLGEDYRLVVDEQVTDLCPATLCADGPPERSEGARSAKPDEVDQIAQIESLLRDATVVLGHRTLPPFLAEDLPAVDQSWGGFLAEDRIEEPSGGGGSPVDGSRVGSSQPATASSKWDALGPGGWTPRFQAGVIADEIDAVRTTVEPTLWFSHGVFPHGPWQLEPTGLQYQEVGRTTPGLDGHRWVQDEWVVRQGFQRHLLQVGYADALVGRLVDKLQAEGLWEDALVVVMADHGISFRPGASPRAPEPETVHEIYNVPLFIKAPGVMQGEVRDDNAMLVDVVPSIVDLLDIETDWEFDGRSLFGRDPEPREKPVVAEDGPEAVPVSLSGLMRVVQRNHERIPGGGGGASVAAIGEMSDLVGAAVRDLEVIGSSDARWSVDQIDVLEDWRPAVTGFVPLFWHGRVTMPDGSQPPSELLAVVNGRVAGVVGGFGADDAAADRYSALIDGAALVEGANEVSLLVPVGGGRRFEQTAGPAQGA